jgi:tRNA threonylcarbamoyladenosine biosynthesis protein TsaE
LLSSIIMPTLDSTAIQIITHSPDHTAHLGEQLGRSLRGGEVVCLQGQLGAGKTVFAQGLGRGWGATDELTSPTFTLIHELTRLQDRAKLYHIDLYRLETETEAARLGLIDLMDDRSSVVIEWPERARSILPPDRLWIAFEYLDETQRRITFTATDQIHQSLLTSLSLQGKGSG